MTPRQRDLLAQFSFNVTDNRVEISLTAIDEVIAIFNAASLKLPLSDDTKLMMVRHIDAMNDLRSLGYTAKLTV